MRPETPPELMLINGTLFLLGYFLPTLLGLLRQRDKRLRLFLLNLLAGWTIVGWMVAFVWAVTLPWDFGRRAPRGPGGAPRLRRRQGGG